MTKVVEDVIDDAIDAGTDIATIEAKELASLEAEMAAQAAELSESLQVTSSNISNAGKQFTLPDGTNLGNKMEIVILGHVRHRELYPDKVYNSNNPEPPICFSKNRLNEASVPHSSVASPESTSCDGCPNNEWGSKGEGKACKETYRVAVIIPSVSKVTPYVLKVVASGRGLTNFDASVSGIQKAFGKNGNLALPFEAIVSAEFTDAQFPVVKVTGDNARLNSDSDKLAYFKLSKDAVNTLL